MAKSKKKENLEVALNKADFETIMDLAAQHRSKKNHFSFCDQLKKIKDSELPKIVNRLITLLMEYMKQNLDENATIDWASLEPENCKMIGQFIHACIDIALACIQCDFTALCRVELVRLAVLLHGIMLPMPDSMESVKNCIAHYCEKLLITGHIDKCEYFLCNVVLYLLRKTLAKKALKADVKRLYAIRKVLEPVIKMEGAPKAELWSLFRQCTVSPTYLSILEGQKVIALIMTLDEDKFLDLNTAVRDIVPAINIKTAISYGKVYFEAWCYCIKAGKSDMKSGIEINSLQNFITMAIRSHQKQVLPLIRKILAQFHIHKKENEVSKMLYGMYQPLIYRYIKNPNGLLRANAAQLFLDIFPLEDPDSRVVTTNLELNDQLLILRDLLVDDFPIVRITTVLGICVSMSVNWEVFPEEMLKTFFRIIVDDLSRDSATSEVRCAVVKGLKCLLENPLTVRCLVSILPKLRGLFHDIAENVRIAFCQLLLRVKKISAIKYFDIVPTHHLFARLEEDCHPVKKAIANLLHNSYFPKNEDPKVWLGRCLEIMKTERLATRVFFSYASCFIGVEGSVKFMVQAARAVHYYVKTKNSSAHIDVELSNKENIQSFTEYITSLEEAVGFSNLRVVSTVMDAIVVMWMSIKQETVTESNKNFLKMLVARIGQPLSDLCLYYKDTESWESVFYASSLLPPSNVPSLASLCFWRLKNLPSTATEDDYMTLLMCLVNQGQTFELLNLLKEWIETGLSKQYVPPPSKKRRSKSKAGDAVYHDEPKPYLANRMLDSMLNHRMLQKATLKEPQVIKEIIYLTDNIKRKLERIQARLITEAEANFLDILMFSILRLAVFLHHNFGADDSKVPFLTDMITWTDEVLLKHIAFIDDTTDHYTTLIFNLCENLCTLISDATALGYIEPDSSLYFDFMHKLLSTDMGHRFVLITCRFLFKHAASSQFMILTDDDPTMLKQLLNYLPKILDRFNDEDILEKIPKISDIEFLLASMMHIVHNHVMAFSEQTGAVFKCILQSALTSIKDKVGDIVREMEEDPFDRLSFPTAGKFFLAIISLKPKLIRTYVRYLTIMLKGSSDIDISTWISYWMVTYNILCMKPLPQPTVKEIAVLVSHLEKHLHVLYPREKDSEPSTSQEQPGSVPLKLFQCHCHAELMKLKSRLKTKLRSDKK